LAGGLQVDDESVRCNENPDSATLTCLIDKLSKTLGDESFTPAKPHRDLRGILLWDIANVTPPSSIAYGYGIRVVPIRRFGL
jgi:hypothetical protein